MQQIRILRQQIVDLDEEVLAMGAPAVGQWQRQRNADLNPIGLVMRWAGWGR
jgi:hypothetical protein